jgi:hypothetical protein
MEAENSKPDGPFMAHYVRGEAYPPNFEKIDLLRPFPLSPLMIARGFIVMGYRLFTPYLDWISAIRLPLGLHAGLVNGCFQNEALVI